MKKVILTTVFLLSGIWAIGQNPIKTVEDKGNFLGIRVDPTLDNLITILEMEPEIASKYGKELKFDVRPTNNFCIDIFPQANTSMSILTRCANRVIFAYSNSEQNVSILSDLYYKLSKQTTSYSEEGFNVFKIEYAGQKYKVKLKSKEEYGALREVVIIDKV